MWSGGRPTGHPDLKMAPSARTGVLKWGRGGAANLFETVEVSRGKALILG